MQVSSTPDYSTCSSPEVAEESTPSITFCGSAPVGEGWGHLIEQIPSVEEMRREVADITCKMQSVYVAERSGYNKTTSTDKETKQQVSVDKKAKKNKVDSLTPSMPSRFRGSLRRTTPPETQLLDSKEKNAFSVLPKVSSSLPRVEQVTEEYFINGKKFRYTYQKRGVLERRTTRDVFLLPASSGEPNLLPVPNNSLEYTSPNFHRIHSGFDTDRESSLTTFTRKTGIDQENPCHGNSNNVTTSKTQFTKPNVILFSGVSTSPLSHGISSNPSNHSSKMKQSDTNRAVDEDNAVTSSTQRGLKVLQGKVTVHGFTNRIRQHMTNNLRRTRSTGRIKFSSKVKPTSPEWQSLSECDMNTTQTEYCRCFPSKGSLESTKSSQAMAGYMYKFGVWDGKAPVLDPRLPQVVRQSVAAPTEYPSNGVVVASPPEWHHAEMGFDSSSTDVNPTAAVAIPQHPMLRGRVVACLQRFTQQSEANGRPLHRSIFVQQTRLVRQRKNGDNSNLTEEVRFPSDSSPDNMAQIFYPAHTGCLKDSGNQQKTHSRDLPHCSNDRLQLLQSICPAAAAATIILGRQSTKYRHATSSESSDDGSDILTDKISMHANSMRNAVADQEERGQIGGLLVMVTATSWCPASLLEYDLSHCLVFNQSLLETSRNISDDLKNSGVGNKLVKQTTMRPSYELAIRGGTLDGLLLYAVHISSLESSTQHMDMLFPHVFRVTYPVFTTHEVLVDKLIQLYVALSPVEPGCQRMDWVEALNIARFLVSIIQDLHTEDLSTRLVLRLSRFAQLLHLDSSIKANVEEHNSRPMDSGSRSPSKPENRDHGYLADILVRMLPLQSRHGNRDTRFKSSSISKTVPSSKYNEIDNEPLSGFNNTKSALGTTYSAAIMRTKQLLKMTPESIALEITRIEEEHFNQIDFREFLDIRRLESGEAKTLSLCVKHFNNLTKWARSQLFMFAPKIDAGSIEDDQPLAKEVYVKHSSIGDQSNTCNAKTVKGNTNRKATRMSQLIRMNEMFLHVCEILKQLRTLKNFSSLLALLLVVQEVPESVLNRKSRNLVACFSNYMMPPKFTDYRRDLEAAVPPYLPYLGLVFQQLIHLRAGNAIFLNWPQFQDNNTKKNSDIAVQGVNSNAGTTALGGVMTKEQACEPEKYINIWRCWKQYLILGYFIKDKEQEGSGRYNITRNQPVFDALNNFNDRVPDADLEKEMEVLLSKNRTK